VKAETLSCLAEVIMAVSVGTELFPNRKDFWAPG